MILQTARQGHPRSCPLQFAYPAGMTSEIHSRIASFRSKGWIDAYREREFAQMLEKDDAVTAAAAEKVTQSLDFVERRMLEKSATDTSAREDDGADIVTSNKENAGTSNQRTGSKEVNSPDEASKIVNQEQMETLFVEMCFFARLGYHQPPMCLHCAYREGGIPGGEGACSKRSKGADKNCSRLVLWRKDAAVPLHPDKLRSNATIVTCRTARAWMRGETVSSLKWDRDAQRLV